MTPDVPGAPRGGGDAPLTVYVVPHTHWDREWYQPFEVFRARLVRVIDEVLDILAGDPGYRRFTLDGQAIVLEDYLALRPERRALLERFVREGRLRIGPWYVLADEFLVSPEALVRNLALGRAVSEGFGPIMPVGYTPDSFGHISQLPLLARGFGLDSIVFERGVGDEGERLRGEFRWCAADGTSEVFAVHLLGTYSAAAALGHVDWELSDAYDPERAARQVRTVLFGPEGDAPDLPVWLRESFERLKGGIAPYATHGAVLLLNGSDHLFPQRNLPAIVDDLNRALPGVRVVHADLEEFLAHARRPLAELEGHRGEFRGSRYQHVLSGVLSSRMYLKQANREAEALLEHYAEPLAALAWLGGAPYPGHLLRHAWRELLQNHPHDSICGCSVDAVHDEMMTRFARVAQVGSTVVDAALASGATQATQADLLAIGSEEPAFLAFNPLPQPVTATVACTLDVPSDGERSWGVVDEAGAPLPAQAAATRGFAPGGSDRTIDHVRVLVNATLPPLGCATFALREGAGAAAAETDLTLDASEGGLVLENAHLRVEIGADGSVVLTGRAAGRAYPLDLRLEDVADAGDTYDFSPLAGDAPRLERTPTAPPSVVERGPARAVVRLAYRLALPERLADDRSARVGSVTLPVTLDLSLDAAARRLELRLELDNRALDHRLRLVIATGCASDRVWADGHFDVLERPARPPQGEGWFQAPRGTNHQRRFVAVSDGRHGLAVLNRGLPEYEALPAATGVDLAVTLLRCVGWLSRTDLASRPQGAGPSLPTPGAQCPGRHVFELALVPFAGAWDEGPLLGEARAFAAPPLVRPGIAPWNRERLALDAPLELTALKRADDRGTLVARVYNPTRRTVRGTLRLPVAAAEVHLVDLAERRQQPLSVDGSAVELTLEPKQVTTLEIVPARPKGGGGRSSAQAR